MGATAAAAMRICALAVTALLCSAFLAEPTLPNLPPPLLTPAEKRAAFSAVTPASLAAFGVSAPRDPSRRVVTGIMSADTKVNGSSGARMALVVQYDYELRGSLRSLVDTAAGRVIGVTTALNDTPSLAPSEFMRAGALALDDPRVRDTLAAIAPAARAEAGVSMISDPQDRMYGYRIARVQFRTDAGYVRTPFAVYVDLTNNLVQLR